MAYPMNSAETDSLIEELTCDGQLFLSVMPTTQGVWGTPPRSKALIIDIPGEDPVLGWSKETSIEIPDDDPVIGWRDASSNDETEAVGVEGEPTVEHGIEAVGVEGEPTVEDGIEAIGVDGEGTFGIEAVGVEGERTGEDEIEAVGVEGERTGEDEIDAVGIEGEGTFGIEAVRVEGERTGEDEMAEGGLNSGCLGGKKRKVKTLGVRIAIPLKDILQIEEMNLEDAATYLKVSRSTLKRVCRGYHITRWPPRKNNELVSNSLPTETPMYGAQQQISQPNSNILLPNQASASDDTNTVTVYAIYENRHTIKFRLSSPWRMVELEKQVKRRLQLEAGTYYIKFNDVKNKLILIGCDEDLADWISDSRSIGANSIEVILEPK